MSSNSGQKGSRRVLCDRLLISDNSFVKSEYHNEQNGYSVIRCRVKGFQDLVTVVGNMPDVHVGAVLSLDGAWRVDAKYGRQFTVEHFEETLPATVFGIEKYLGSGMIKGIGPKFAQRIVRQFGKDTLDVIEERPDRLLEVPGIGKKRVERIKKSWHEQKEIKNIMLFLQSHDVSTAHATKIYKTYGESSLSVVRENPYRLADDIWGIGFRTADIIATKLGFEKEKFVRLRSGILYTLNQLANDGHCYATRDQLIQTGSELLKIGTDALQLALDEMLLQDDVITDGEAIYLLPFYYAEVGTAKRLQAIASDKSGSAVDTTNLAETISRETGMEYDPTQIWSKRGFRGASASLPLTFRPSPQCREERQARRILTKCFSSRSIRGRQVCAEADICSGNATKSCRFATTMRKKCSMAISVW